MNSFAKRVVVALCGTLSIPCVSFASTATYTVHRGDSLWGIAHAHQTSVQALMTLNHLHRDALTVGQKLDVPVSPSRTPAKPTPSHPATTKSIQTIQSSSTVTMTVHAGDTLSSIARRYHTSVSSLEKWNGLNARSVLHVGQRLKVGETSQSNQPLTSRSGGIPGLGADIFGANVAAYAKQFIGVPYRWGGRSPSGFDCSGFVQFVFGHFGIPLPRTSYDMYRLGSSVTRSDLMPGDLVFSDTYGGGASHVGIYLGGGRFVSAQSEGVEIASLSESYWARHYIGAKHVGK